MFLIILILVSVLGLIVFIFNELFLSGVDWGILLIIISGVCLCKDWLVLFELFVFGVKFGIICVNKFCNLGFIFRWFLICFFEIMVIDVGILLIFLIIWFLEMIICFIFFWVLLVKEGVLMVKVMSVSDGLNMKIFLRK